jgi:hypothetical protein
MNFAINRLTANASDKTMALGSGTGDGVARLTGPSMVIV